MYVGLPVRMKCQAFEQQYSTASRRRAAAHVAESEVMCERRPASAHEMWGIKARYVRVPACAHGLRHFRHCVCMRLPVRMRCRAIQEGIDWG